MARVDGNTSIPPYPFSIKLTCNPTETNKSHEYNEFFSLFVKHFAVVEKMRTKPDAFFFAPPSIRKFLISPPNQRHVASLGTSTWLSSQT